MLDSPKYGIARSSLYARSISSSKYAMYTPHATKKNTLKLCKIHKNIWPMCHMEIPYIKG